MSPKGGTGKSSIATGLAVAAAGSGATCLYDLDPQATSHRWFHIHRTNSPKPPPELPLTVRRVEPGGILERLRQDADPAPPDWLVCDLAGGAYAPLAEAFELSDVVLVPLRPTAADLSTVSRLREFAETLGPGSVGRMTAVLCQVDGRSVRRREFSRSVLEDDLGIGCCRTHSSQSVVWPDAFEVGRSVAEMEGVRFRRAAGEITDLYREVRELIGRGGSR